MTVIEGSVFCNNCGVEITWAPIVIKKCHYCCRNCLYRLPCDCGDRMEMEEDRRQKDLSPAIFAGESYD